MAEPIWPVGEWPGGGFQDRLIACIRANTAKLREARPREGHLVVDIGMPGLSGDPCDTPPPPLEDGVDVLWVILGYYNAKHDFRLWRKTAARPTLATYVPRVDGPIRTTGLCRLPVR